MRKLRLMLLAAAVFTIVLVFHGTAEAVELLENPGAEAGVLVPWISDPVGGSVGNTLSAHTGSWYFSTATGPVISGGSLSISQEVDVSACGVDGLPGLWEATGYSVSDSATDTGQVAVMFDDGSSAASAAAANAVYGQLGPISGIVGAGASLATVSMVGTDVDLSGNPDVRFDDLSFNVTCLTDFAKVGGKIIGEGGKGFHGRAGQWSFDGTVGHLEDMTLTGDISINYKVLGQTCVFTPDTLAYSDSTAMVTATYLCDDPAATSGTATLLLTQGAGGPNRGNGKDRGGICVDADAVDGSLDITNNSGCALAGDEVALNNGNVKVSPPEPM